MRPTRTIVLLCGVLLLSGLLGCGEGTRNRVATATAIRLPIAPTVTETPWPTATETLVPTITATDLPPTAAAMPSVTVPTSKTMRPSPTLRSRTVTPLPPNPRRPTATIGATRISFRRGATSATVHGRVDARSVQRWVLRANAGQTLEVDVISERSRVLLTIVGADGVPLKRYVDGQAHWKGRLPTTQDYVLEAVSAGEASPYDLQVTLCARVNSPQEPHRRDSTVTWSNTVWAAMCCALWRDKPWTWSPSIFGRCGPGHRGG